MKFFTIAIILATIAGSVTTAPAPRALKQVNPFERDVEIYSRWWWESEPHRRQRQHRKAASVLNKAVKANEKAKKYINKALQVAQDNAWAQRMSAHHTENVSRLSDKHGKHLEAARETDGLQLYQDVGPDIADAKGSIVGAKNTIDEAKYKMYMSRRLKATTHDMESTKSAIANSVRVTNIF